MAAKPSSTNSPQHPAAKAPVPGNAVPDAMGDVSKRDKLGEKLRQPHERDESPDNGKRGTDRNTDQPQGRVSQAHEDVERDLPDTDRRGVPSEVPDSRDNRAP